MTEKATVIRIKGTENYLKDVVLGLDGITVKGVTYTNNVFDAQRFDTSNYAENFIQSAEDSGHLVEAFSNPLIGGANVFEVVPIGIGAPRPRD